MKVDDCWFEWFNDEGEPMLLVPGVGGQGCDWDDSLCEVLAARGFRVLRYDLRDSGKSRWMTELPPIDADAVASGDHTTVSYRVDDLARDVICLLDALELETVHIVGHSLGGMIAQACVIEMPHRFDTLVSIASSTGAGDVGQAHPRARTSQMGKPSGDEITARVERRRTQSGSGFAFDEARVRRNVTLQFERGNYPDGRLRHLAAAVCSPDRTDALGRVAVPSLVVHGDDDPVVDVSGASATAEALTSAELWIVEGMGHYIEPAIFDRLALRIRRLADAAKA